MYKFGKFKGVKGKLNVHQILKKWIAFDKIFSDVD